MSTEYLAALPLRKAAQINCAVLPLSMVSTGEKVIIQSIRGKDDSKRFLNTLGFVENAEASVISELGGNIIINIKGTRIAISKLMANKIMTTII